MAKKPTTATTKMAELGKGKKTAEDYLRERAQRLNGEADNKSTQPTIAKTSGGGSDSASGTTTATTKMAELGKGKKTAEDYLEERRRRQIAQHNAAVYMGNSGAISATKGLRDLYDSYSRQYGQEKAQAVAANAGTSAAVDAMRNLANALVRNEERAVKETPEAVDTKKPPVMINGHVVLNEEQQAEYDQRRRLEAAEKVAANLEGRFDTGEWAKANAKAGFTAIGGDAMRTANAMVEPVRNWTMDAMQWLNEKRDDIRIPTSGWFMKMNAPQYNIDNVETGSLPRMEDAIKAYKEQSALGDIYNWFTAPQDKWQQIAQTENEKGGMWANIGGQILQNAVRQLPDTLMALMSGGTSMLGRGADVVTDGLGKAVYEYAKDMVTSPNFLTAYASMYGQGYEDRVDQGADPMSAALTSTIATLMNTVVEMGGGIEDLPFNENNLREWVTSMLDEGKEEVIQQVIDNLANKAMVNGETPWFSMTDDKAVINPKVLGENFLVGALAGGTMTGPGMVINSMTQAAQDNRARTATQDAIRELAEKAAEAEAAVPQTDVAGLAMQTAENEAQSGAVAAQESAGAKTQNVPQRAAETATQAQAGAQGTQDVQRAQYMESAQEAGKKYGDRAALVFAQNYTGGDVKQYDAAFNALYSAGKVGLRLSDIGRATDALTAGLSETTKQSIWQAGANSRMTEVVPGAQKMYTQKATAVQKRQIAMLNEIGRRYGVEIDIVDSIDSGLANGAYSGGRKIVVALDAAEGAILQTGVHELTHYLKRTDSDSYGLFRDVVLEHLNNSGAFDLELAITERGNQYAGQNMTREDLIEEIIAEAAPTFLTDEQAVRAFVKKDPGLAQKIRDFFVKFAKEIREIAERYMQRDGAERYEITNLLGRSDALTEIAEAFDAALETASMGQEAEAGETVFARKKNGSGKGRLSLATGEGNRGEVSAAREGSLTESDAFRKWFGDSKIVDENGSPKVVYHQTAGDFSVFNTNNPVAGLNDSETPNGMFFKTNDHDIGLDGDKQMAVYLKMENPLHFANRKEANAWYRKHVDGYAELSEEFDAAAEKFNADVDRVSDEIFATDDEDRIQELEAEVDRLIEDFKPVEDDYRGRLRKLLDDYFLSGKSGYDGIELDYDGHRYVNGVRENVHTFIVFKPTQIKSATDNVGTFDPENPDIRFSLNVTPAQTRRIEADQPVNGEVEAKWSLARNEEFMDNARNINAKTGNVDQATMDQAAKDRAQVKAFMETHTEAMKLPADIEGDTFFADGAYGGSEESTSVCVRSMAVQELMDLIGKNLGRPLTVEDTLVISQEVAAYTDKAECYYCYVAQDRRAMREFLGTYLEQRDDVLKRYKAGEDKGKVYTEWLNGRKDTKNMRDRFAMWTKAVDEGGALITPKDLASLEDLNAEITTLQTRIAEAIGGKVQFAGLGYKQDGGRTKSFAGVLKTADAALKADINRYIQLADALQYAKSASWAKKQSGYAAYNGHILKWSADKVKGFNDHYGLRMYSFSDFSPAFILENMQMLTDAAAKGLKVLAYTKELDFVRVFAGTGANINISVFATEINGQITADGMMGADWAQAIELRKKYPNVGITFVATNDNLAAWAEAQDWIDTVIPYHLVRTGQKVADYFGYKNYTQVSSDKKKPGIKFKKGDVTSITPEMHGNDIVKYVEALEKYNLTPRFADRMAGYQEFLESMREGFPEGKITPDQFRAMNPYYMKYVNETRRSAQETPPVQPVFDVQAAEDSMRTLIKEGGYGAPIGQSYEVMQEIAEEIADKIRTGVDTLQNQPKFSLNNTSPASTITDENQNLSLPVDVKVDARAIADHAKKALVAGLDSGLTERMQLQIKGIANKIMNETGSEYSKDDFIGNMTRLIEQYAQSGWTEDTLRAVTEMSRKVIEQSRKADTTLRDQYSDLRKRLRETGIAFTEAQKQEAANIAGSYGEYRKGLMGSVKLAESGMTLEAMWDELSTEYPELFAQGTNEGDMVQKLQDFTHLMQPRYENPYGMDMDGAALEMAMRIEGDIMGIIGVKDAAKAMYGSAGKLRARFEQEFKEKLKQQKTERVQRFQQIAADLKAAKAAGDSAAQSKAMSQYRAAMKATGLDEAYAEIRATLQARQEAKAETAERNKVIGRVEKQTAEMLEMFRHPKKGKRIPTGLQGMVLEALEMLDINGSKAASEGRDTIKAKEFRDKLTGIREFYENVVNSQSAGKVPDELEGLMMTISERNLASMVEALDVLSGGDRFVLRDMTSDQLKSLSDLLKNIKHTVESVGKLWRIQRYQSVVELGDASIEEMDDRGPEKLERIGNQSIRQSAKGARDFFVLGMMDPISYGERLGEGGSTVIQSLMDGEKEKFGKVKAASEAMGRMMKDAGVSGYDIGKWKQHVQTVKFANGQSVRMTDAMIMSLYLTAQRPQGIRHLLGKGFTIREGERVPAHVDDIPLVQADLDMIARLMADKRMTKQRKLADAMQAYLSTDVAKWGNDVTQRLYLYDAFTEGKYWPLISDPKQLKTEEPEGDRAFNAIVNAGFTKPLDEKANNSVVIQDAFKVFERHISEMASYAGYAEVMTDTMAWINYRQRDENGLTGKDIKGSMAKLLGEGGQKYLTKLVQDINGARRGGDAFDFGGGWLNKLTGKAKAAAVAGKIRVVMQQPTSIVRAASEINPVYLLGAMKPTWGSVKEMQKWSNLAWWKANGNYDIGVGKSMDKILFGDTRVLDTTKEVAGKAVALGLDPGKADDLTWSRIWEAVKLETKRKRKDLKVGSDEYFRAVAERFEAICDRTQVVDTVMHRSDVMRSKDGMAKNLTAFMGEPIKSYNMLMRSTLDVLRNPKNVKTYGKLVRTGMAYVASVAATTAATALFDALKYRDDDDPLWEYLINGGLAEDWTQQFLKSFWGNLNPASNIVLIKDIIEMLSGGEAPSVFAFEIFRDISDAVETLRDYVFGENKKKLTWYGAIKPAANMIGTLTGYPVNGLLANAEMLAHAYDPKLLQTKSDMQTMGDAYDKLYQAMLAGNTKEALAIRTELNKGMYGNTPKNAQEIDTGIAKAMAMTDERILKAWKLKQEGRTKELVKLYKEIQADGFTDDQVKKAANSLESYMTSEYRGLLEEGKTEEAGALKAKAAKYGMKLTEKQEKDMEKELEAKTLDYKSLFAAIRSGDEDDIGDAVEILIAEADEKTRDGRIRTREDKEDAVRSEVSEEFREEYVGLVRGGKTNEAEKLAAALEIVGFDEEKRTEWVKDSYRDDLKQSVADGDMSEAESLVETMKEEYDMTDSAIATTVRNEFRQQYIDLVIAGKEDEADELAEKLIGLGLKGKEGNYFRQSNLNKWVTDWEKAQEEE